MSVQSRREGFALAGAVLAMLVVGVIVTGGFYAANHQSSAARSQYRGDLAQYIAETGLDMTVANVGAGKLDSMAVGAVYTKYSGQSVSYGGTAVGTFTGTVTKLTANLFVVQSAGVVTIGGANSGASRTVGTIVRNRIVGFDNSSAMQIYGDLEVAGTADVNGSDTYLSSTWSGCTTNSTTSAVTAQPSASVSTQGSGDINGTVTRSNMDTTRFTVFGDLSWSDLTALATFTYPAGTDIQPDAVTSGGACVTSDNTNWGAPKSSSSPCFTWFPILHAEGNLAISSNGSGQGILLVDGDLDITGQFEFYGPVIVRGTIFLRGGSLIYGNIYALGGGVVGADNNLAGNMVVQYSSCSIKRAVLGASGLSRGVPIKDRAWFDLSSIQNSY